MCIASNCRGASSVSVKQLRLAIALLLLWQSPGFAQEDAEPPPESPGTDAPSETPPSEDDSHDHSGHNHGPPVPSAPPEEARPELLPPAVLEASPASGDRPALRLHVLIDAEGTVLEFHGAGDAPLSEEDLAAAGRALARWRFRPAQRSGENIASRVSVLLPFVPQLDLGDEACEHPSGVQVTEEPSASTADEDASADEAVSANADEDEALPEETDELGFGAQGSIRRRRLRAQERGASALTVERDILQAAPQQSGADLLRTAPGVFVARSEGDAVAHRISLRGFDAEHGQDLELRVGGIPVNLPSHIHGQGYADLGFVIPSVVRSLDVLEGVSDPQQGDFAVAGSMHMHLGVEDRGLRLEGSYGAFNAASVLAVWAPEGEDEESFAAVQLNQTDGFGSRRRALGGSAIAQHTMQRGAWRFRLLGMGRATRADLAGVLRRDDIDAGRVGFYDAYSHPSAQSQNALALRVLAGAFAEHRGESGNSTNIGLWFSQDQFRIQENFTGFIARSQSNPDWVGRGDLIEQQNATTSFGLDARHLTAPFTPWSWLKASVEIGLSTRLDLVSQNQRLIQAPQNQTWDERVDADIQGADIGLYGDLTLEAFERVTLRVGARADTILYQVDDRLGNRIPDFRSERYILGYRRSAAGIVAGPRTSLGIKLTPWLRLLASYGEGFRSPQGRTLEDGETAPFTKVRGGDVGLAFELDEALSVHLTAYQTNLSDDVAFEPREGRLERLGATRRRGGVLYLLARPTAWLRGAASLTYVDAELQEPPPATAEDPQPPFVRGQSLPYVAPWVFRLDASANGSLDIGEETFSGELGLGLSHLSPRPLPYGGEASPVTLLDASAAVHWRRLGLRFSMQNLLDSRYSAAEFNFASDWNFGSPRSRLPARHSAAGAPRSWNLSLEVRL